MLKKINKLFGSIVHFLLGENDPISYNKSSMDDSVLLEKARADWQAAHSFFNYVSDEKQIDQAIFNLIATEKHYDNLLQRVRREHWYNRKVNKRCK